MDKNVIRDEILRALYHRFQTNNRHDSMSVTELATIVGLPKDIVDQQVDFLNETGFVKEGSSDTCEITTKGVLYADGPGPFNPMADFNRQVIEVQGGNTNIVQAGGNVSGAQQSHGITLEALLAALSRHVEDHPDLPEEDKHAWKKVLDDVVGNPDYRALLVKSLNSLLGHIFC